MEDIDVLISFWVEKAKNGDTDAFEKILKHLEQDLKKIANKYYIVGSDEKDVMQECRLGLFNAIKYYNHESNMKFKYFTLLCCKRHLMTAMSHANTQKFKLQNEAVSLSAPVSNSEDEGIQTYADYIPDPNSDLLQNYIIQEEFNNNIAMVSVKLTPLEMAIFGQFAHNSSYKDIADALGVKHKAVDNALLRIKKKARETIDGVPQLSNQSIIYGDCETHTGIGTNFSV